MGKKEKGVRALETGNSPRKAQGLKPKGSGRGGAASLEEAVTSDASRDCEHFPYDTAEMYTLLEKIESLKRDPQCVDCQREDTAARKLKLKKPKPRFVMCAECTQCFCAGLASNGDWPRGHAGRHARIPCHAVVLWIDQPDVAYCFRQGHDLCLKVIAFAAHAHAPGPGTDELGYVVRGMLNRGNTCYVNALVQCLLALDKMRVWMLGPNAPTGPLGVALKELFVETRSGNDAGATLDLDKKLLKSVSALNKRYKARTQEDSQEMLLHMRNGLNEEEKLKWPPNMPEDFPTVVDSIFQGQVSSTLICKCCQHNSPNHDPFYELSLALPPEEHPTKSVAPPQRSGRQERKGIKQLFREIWEEEKVQKVAHSGEPLETDKNKVGDSNSLPSIKDCLAYHFRKEVVERRCESCSKVPEKPSTTQSKDGGQMVASINEGTSVDRDQTGGHHRKAKEKSDLLSVHDNQNASTLNQDRKKQIELENTANQVGEGQNKQKDMGEHADKAFFLSKLPAVLTLHVLRFKGNDKRIGHVKFEENLDVGTYLDPRSEGENNSRYRLVGVIEHIGNSSKAGHYVAYVRGSRIGSDHQLSSDPSSWFRASDESIREVSLDDVLKCEAFLLFYEDRRSRHVWQNVQLIRTAITEVQMSGIGRHALVGQGCSQLLS